MRHCPTHFTAVLVLLFLGGIHVTRGDDQPASRDLGKIQPPGGAPLRTGKPGTPISNDYINKATRRLESAPEADIARWVVEMERITEVKLDGWLEEGGCRTYFVTRMSLAFNDLEWNAKAADKLFQRAQTMPAAEARAWKEAFEALLKKEVGRAYFVPLVLIPVGALHEGEKFSVERGRKYLARLKQLTADDVALWTEKVDEFEGTQLDAAINIILLGDYFDQEKFQREMFKAAVEARKVSRLSR